MEIYWIQDKQRRGPATVPDVMDMIHRGELSPDTKGWHAGVQGWKPLRELPALADFLNKGEEPPPPDMPEIPTQAASAPAAGTAPLPPEIEPGIARLDIHLPKNLVGEFQGGSVTLPSPWLRLLARMVDTFLYMALALGVLYMLNLPFNQYYLPGSPLFWLPMLLIEAYCLQRWHTTPGKRLMGIFLSTLGEDSSLSYGRAFMRAFLVYFLGMGMISFPLILIMLALSYWALRSRGICWWDLRALTLPIRREGKPMSRVLAALATIYVCLVAAGIFMKPWLKPMYEELAKADPDMARFMVNLMPELEDKTAPGTPVQQPLE